MRAELFELVGCPNFASCPLGRKDREESRQGSTRSSTGPRERESLCGINSCFTGDLVVSISQIQLLGQFLFFLRLIFTVKFFFDDSSLKKQLNK